MARSEEVFWPVRTRSIAIRLVMQLKRKTSGLSECGRSLPSMAPLHQSILGQVPLRFLTLHRLRSLTQFLSTCSLSQETSSGLGRWR